MTGTPQLHHEPTAERVSQPLVHLSPYRHSFVAFISTTSIWVIRLKYHLVTPHMRLSSLLCCVSNKLELSNELDTPKQTLVGFYRVHY